MKSLAEWLAWQDKLHLSSIDLGLERLRQVTKCLNLMQLPFPIITVAGTNGKGSVCAMLTQSLHAAGHRVGTYTSPHILHYNERIAINGVPASDADICAAFEAIDAARGDTTLTLFEFGTLAAIYLFQKQQMDVVVLEVGLGGRLDAANLWDAHVAIVTSIGIDHVEWLGDDREVIAAEKAAIARVGRTLICGDNEPPDAIKATADRIGAVLWQWGRDFVLQPQTNAYPLALVLHEQVLFELPYPSLQGEVQWRNMACAVLALHQLALDYPALQISPAIFQQTLQNITLDGRWQQLRQSPDVWLDVAHNAQAANELAMNLRKVQIKGHTFVLFSQFKDKDVLSVVESMHTLVSEWHVFTLPSERAMNSEQLAANIKLADPSATIHVYDSIQSAWQTVEERLTEVDRVVAFGSFLVVSEMLKTLTSHTHE